MPIFNLIITLIPLIAVGSIIFVIIKEVSKISNAYNNLTQEDFINFLNSRYQTSTKIDIQNITRPDYKHSNCLTEGNVKHPEKVGNLKTKNNPFEL